jgi:hypothetical protein
MGEKRKPTLTILLKKSGKSSGKVEIYPASLWGVHWRKYRLKVNGKWYPPREKVFYYKTQIKEMFFQSLDLG